LKDWEEGEGGSRKRNSPEGRPGGLFFSVSGEEKKNENQVGFRGRNLLKYAGRKGERLNEY